MDLSKVHLHWRKRRYKSKEYKYYSLASSYRLNGKVRKKIVERLGALTDIEVCKWKLAIASFKKPSSSEKNEIDYNKSLIAEKEVMKKKFEYSTENNDLDISSYMEAVKSAFAEVEDIRTKDNIHYPFYGILLIVLAATLAGCTAISHIYEYAKTKKELFCQLLELNHIPSYMTFWWCLTRMNSNALNQAFMRWIELIAKNLDNKIIAIDGKRLRGAKNNLVHYVSAYECNKGLLLGQVKTEEKSNEITAIPELLKVIDVKDAIITIDAAGCQKTIVRDIIAREGNYLIALKGNQGTLLDEVEKFFNQARINEYKDINCDKSITIDKGHGRIETREIIVTQNLQWLSCISDWKDLNTVIEIKSTRVLQSKTSIESRYYISNKIMNAKELGNIIRSHWGIENQLHWILDVVFHDDSVKANAGHAAENLGLFRRMAYSLLKQDVTKSKSMATKQRLAIWEESYVLYLLSNYIKEVHAKG